MDIRSASLAASQIPVSGHVGAAESAANVTKVATDSMQERKEVGKADPGKDSGQSVDIEA